MILSEVKVPVDKPSTDSQPTLQVERYDLQLDPYELENQCYGGLPSSCPTDAEQLTLERDLQRLSRALLSTAPPPRSARRVRWPRVRRANGGYPAL